VWLTQTCLQMLLTKHKAISTVFFEKNFEQVGPPPRAVIPNGAARSLPSIMPCCTQRTTSRSVSPSRCSRSGHSLRCPTEPPIQLLGELLLDRANFKIMMRYINDPENLKTMMNLLKGQTKQIQFEAFHGWSGV
jgi:hypothetical protein